MRTFQGFQRQALLSELGFIGMRPTLSIFKTRFKEKGKDLRRFHVRGEEVERVLMSDEIDAIYSWLFDPVVAVIPPKKTKPKDLQEYELDLKKVEYSEFKKQQLEIYLNSVFKEAQRLYIEAKNSSTLIKDRELFIKTRRKKGLTTQKTRVVHPASGRKYAVPMIRHSFVLPTKKTCKDINTVLEQIYPLLSVLHALNEWEAVEALLDRVKPLLNADQGLTLEAQEYLAPLFRLLNQIEVSKITKTGKRILNIKNIPDFYTWLQQQGDQ